MAKKKLNAWEEVQNLVNRAKQTAGTLVKSPVGRFVSNVGRTAVNTVAPGMNLVGQATRTPQFQTAFRSSAQQLGNTIRQGVPATARLAINTRPPSPIGFNVPKFYKGQGSDIVKAGTFMATAYGAPRVTPQLMALSGTLGGAFNRYSGGSFSEGFGKGVAISPQLSGIGRVTNPIINKAARRISSRFVSPVGRQISSRLTTGTLNVPEGTVMDQSLGYETTPGSIALDFAIGAITGRTGIGSKANLVRGTGKATYTKDAIEQVMEPKNRRSIINTLSQFDQAFGPGTAKSGVPDMKQANIVRSNLEFHYKQLYGASAKLPQNIYELRNAIANGFKELTFASRGGGLEGINALVGEGQENVAKAGLSDTKRIKLMDDKYLKIRELQIRYREAVNKEDVQQMTSLKKQIDDIANNRERVMGSERTGQGFKKVGDILGETQGKPQPPSPVKNVEGTVLEAGGGRFELKDLNTTDDVIKLIKQTAAESDKLIEGARRGTVSFEDTRKAADLLGTTVEQLKNRKAGKALNDAEIVRAGDILKTKFESLNQQKQAYQQAIENGTTTEAQKLQMMADIEEASLIMSKVLGAEAEAGRALNATKILKRILDNPTEEKIRQAKKYLGAREDIDEIVKKFIQLDLTNPEEGYRFLRSVNKSNFGDKALEYWYNSILSSPTTHLINSISNSMVSLLAPVERAATAGVEAVVAPLAGRKRQAFFGEAPAELVGMTRGLTVGVRKALEIMKRGYSMEDAAKLELRRPQAITTPYVGTAINIPSRMLVAADAFFKSINYQGTLEAEAYRMARNSGAKGKELARQMAETIANPPPILMNKAKKIASYRVFQQEPGEITKKFLALRSSKFKGVPALQFVFPFVQTPVNLVKFGLERTPLGFANALGKQGVARSEALAKAMIGTSLAGAIAMYSWDGKISGAPPKDRVERDTLYKQGWQPYSIKIGNKWISYQRLEPFNQIFTQIALMKDAFIDNKELPTTDKIQRVALGVASNLTSQTYMSGISDILNAIEDPERYGGSWIERQASSVIPASSLLRMITRTTDPTVRDPQGVGEALKTTIPGLSQQVAPKLNEFGEPIVREGGVLRQAFPIKYTTETRDVRGVQSTFKEIRDLKRQSTEASAQRKTEGESLYKTLKSLPKEEAYKRAEKLKTENRRLYDEMVQVAQDEKLGLSPVDKRIRSLGVEDGSRAKYLYGKFNQLKTKQEKAAYWEELQKKKIITNQVGKQVIYLIKNNGSTN